MRASLSIPLVPGWIGVSGLLLIALILQVVYPPLSWAVLALSGMGALGWLLGSSWLCSQLMILGVFTGVLTSVSAGFTLKAPQLFALLGLMAFGLGALRRRELPDFPWHWALPFILFVVSILPSFLADRKSVV